MDHASKKSRIDESLNPIESEKDDEERPAEKSLDYARNKSEIDNSMSIVQSEEHEVNRTKEPVEVDVQSENQVGEQIKDCTDEETDNHSCHKDKLIEQVFLSTCTFRLNC